MMKLKEIVIGFVLCLLLLSSFLTLSACQTKKTDSAATPGTPPPQNSTTTAPTTPQNSPSASLPKQLTTEAKYVQSAGVVVSINPQFPSVELNHEEIKGIMPAMQMEFYVKDKAMLDGLKPGDKVTFTLEDKGGAELITELRKK